MAGDNRLVTEDFLRLNFTPKSGVTPGTDNEKAMDCDQITGRYNVTIDGTTSTGRRCPSQNQITGLSAPTISVYGVTSNWASVDCSWMSYPEYLTARGYVLFHHSLGLITDVPESDEIAFITEVPLNTYMYLTGGYSTTNLQPNTTYYTRAFYQTATGTYYGPEISFTTQP